VLSRGSEGQRDGLNERFGGLAKAGQVNKRNESGHGVGRERNKSAKKSRWGHQE